MTRMRIQRKRKSLGVEKEENYSKKKKNRKKKQRNKREG